MSRYNIGSKVKTPDGEATIVGIDKSHVWCETDGEYATYAVSSVTPSIHVGDRITHDDSTAIYHVAGATARWVWAFPTGTDEPVSFPANQVSVVVSDA